MLIINGSNLTHREYEVIKAAKMESGNAWEIQDQSNSKTVGYIDPGGKPRPSSALDSQDQLS